jgi:uncharacterized protein (DUF488 family)
VETMLRTLKNYNVDFLVDVRSIPYSKQYPQCNSENLKAVAEKFAVGYIHVPELGAKASPQQDVFSKASDIFFDDIFPISKSKRPEKTELQSNEEIVDFNKFRHDEYFITGLKRIERAYDKDYTLALMCSEKNPIDCHRYFLISKALENKFGKWLGVRHILIDKNEEVKTISNEELNKDLIDSVFNKEEIKRLQILGKDLFSGEAKIDNYFGKTIIEKKEDFCDRYWNLMHGWKRVNNNNTYDYD